MKNTLFLLALLYTISGYATSTTDSYNIKLLPISEQLPNRTVKRIMQDKRGFIWFGTEAGLCRYDGYKTMGVKTAQGMEKYYSSNNIQCLTEDIKGRIWAGTRLGIKIVDKNGIEINLFDNNTIQEKRITSLLSDGKYVWVGTHNGLFRYNTETSVFTNYLYIKGRPGTVPSGSINAIFRDRENRLWIAVWGQGLCLFDEKKNEFIQLPPIGERNVPFHIEQDSEGVFWISTWGDGLLRMTYDSKNGQAQYHLYDISHLYNLQQGRNVIYNTVEDKLGRIWMVTPRGLVVMRDKKKGIFEKILTQNVYNESSNFLHHLYKDKDDNIWVGASNDGVYLITTGQPFFQYNILDKVKKAHGYTIINSIHHHDGLLWCALTNGGALAISAKTNEPVHFDPSYNISCRSTIRIPHKKEIWILGDAAISRLKTDKKQWYLEDINLRLDNANGKKFDSNNLSTGLIDNKNKIWLCGRDGIYIYPYGKYVTKIKTSFNDVQCLYQANDSTIWAGSYSLGAIKFVERDGKLHLSQYNINNGKLNARTVMMFLYSKQGTLWLCSENGLFSYNQQKDAFEKRNAEFEVLDNNISNIAEDAYGNLWLTANDRIIKIDTKRKVSQSFSSYDNVRVANFRPHTACVLPDGTIYFGGNEGICYFKPKRENDADHINPVIITDIEVQNKSIFDPNNKEQNLINDNQLSLNYQQQNIGIEFSALNYTNINNLKYAYMLEGVDREWIFVDSKRHFVNYNNLAPGKYVFNVKSADKNGRWNQEATQLYIHIEPAPYLTWWAYCIYGILLIFASILVIRIIRNRINMQNQLTIAAIEKEKNEELTQTKLRYFTNVSHELLTPLTIIGCLTDELYDSHPHITTQYTTMKANINRLKRLLQQILDFRKTESANMKLEVKNVNLSDIVHHICELNFAPLIKEKAIHFDIKTPAEPVMAWVDEDKMDKILFNLLSNAFKYTDTGGKIVVTIQPYQKEESEWVKIFVSDTGCGIAPYLLPNIFNRFVSNTQNRRIEANGIGLSLAKDLAELHKGNISVQSEVGVGSTFIFEFPTSENAYEDHKIVEQSLHSDSFEPVAEEIESDPEYKADCILLVEDEPELLAALQRYFSRHYTVELASNGVDALEIIKEKDIDLIISDVMMDKMNGLELCSHVKQDIATSHIPIILLTAKSQIEDRIECYNSGADSYITKPFNLPVLAARVSNLLSKRNARNAEYKKGLDINIKQLQYSSLDEKFLNEVIEIIETYLSDFDLSPEILIEKLHTTRSTLYRKIKSLTGLSIGEFIKDIRLRHASTMLQSKKGNVSDIAYDVGFNDPKYFSTCFRVKFGCSPREYCKQTQKED